MSYKGRRRRRIRPIYRHTQCRWPPCTLCPYELSGQSPGKFGRFPAHRIPSCPSSSFYSAVAVKYHPTTSTRSGYSPLLDRSSSAITHPRVELLRHRRDQNPFKLHAAPAHIDTWFVMGSLIRGVSRCPSIALPSPSYPCYYLRRSARLDQASRVRET